MWALDCIDDIKEILLNILEDLSLWVCFFPKNLPLLETHIECLLLKQYNVWNSCQINSGEWEGMEE